MQYHLNLFEVQIDTQYELRTHAVQQYVYSYTTYIVHQKSGFMLWYYDIIECA